MSTPSRTLSVTVLTSFYPPESTAPSRRAFATARFLADSGWNVTVVTLAPNYPQGRVYEGYGARAIDDRMEEGIRVIRLRPWVVNKANFAKRFLSELSIAARMVRVAGPIPADLVFATSPSMFLGPAGRRLGRRLKAKVVWEVRDLIWLYAQAVRRRSYGIDRLLELIMLATGRGVDALVTTTRGQMEYFVKRERAPARILVAPNGVSRDVEELLIGEPRATVGARPRIVYAGLVGFPQGLRTLVDAAALLPEYEFVIAGDGGERSALAAHAAALGLRNVTFTGHIALQEVARLYASADVLFAQLRKSEVFAITQPSKLWEYMMAGKPIVYAGEGEAAAAVNTARCGLVVPPEDADAVAEAIRHLVSNPSRSSEYGENGRSHALTHLRRDVVLQQLERFLRATAEVR